MAAYLLPPGDDVPRRSLDALAREVEEAARLRHQADLAGLGATLPGLLEELRAATHILKGSEREQAFWLLGEAYCAAWQVVYKLGYLDLASLTEDRVAHRGPFEWAAARCGDELAVLRGDYGRAGELITSGEFTGARGYLERSRATIEDRLGRADAPTLSMWGNLAPQQTRYHPMVHETIRMLARHDRRRSSPVAGFATWCGIS